ncbi:HAMP domain-containing protein (plasmid) [Rhodococcus sp. USK10]|uniref:sensor histidine kinase n=1 Tax=Rhodococcus sp. USK10 TaxID=2789739 RepID=UPI001C5E4902|nr:ATP-binding protein [Rhodococcus sp. USK10]QYA99856.1 HAMP domain-containing protein [Rhodococcus sp. USK10]
MIDTGLPSRSAVVSISSWPLRWKMAVVLIVPFVVATSLGALRVQERLREAADFTVVADRIRVVPLLIELDSDVAVVTGTLAQRTVTADLIDNLDATIRNVESLDPSKILTDDAARTVTDALASAQALSTQARRGPTAMEALTEQLDAIRNALGASVRAIMEPIVDHDVAAYARGLEGLWAAQKMLSPEGLAVVAATPMHENASDRALAEEAGALRAHLQTEGVLLQQAAQLPFVDREAVAALQQLVADRVGLLASLDSPGNAARVLDELKLSLFTSIDQYETAVSAASAALSDAVTAKSSTQRIGAWRDTTVVMGLLLTAVVLAVLVARSLLAPLRRLRRGALEVAHIHLPEAVARMKTESSIGAPDIEPIDVHTTEEIGQVARAIDGIHSQALRLAGEQARLRMQMTRVFETLARRSRSLVDSQLELIEQLEFEERDAARLDNLFRLDHLATRMRRHGENLLILAGNRDRRTRQPSLPVTDAVRAAVSEVEDYRRVQVQTVPDVALTGASGADLVRILAELVDNALQFSSPDTTVTVHCTRTLEGGLLIEVADRGIGMSPDDLDAVNERLANGTFEVSADTARRMGLFVVGTLAARHAMTIALRATLEMTRNAGITVTVTIPGALLITAADRNGNSAAASVNRRVRGPAIQQAALIAAPSTTSDPHNTNPTEPAAIAPVESGGKEGSDDSDHPRLPHRTPGASIGAGRTPPIHTAAVDNTEDPQPIARHRLRRSRTTAFFEPRVFDEDNSASPIAPPPIFASIAPAWLTDPTTRDSLEWASSADEGWSAAQRAGESSSDITTTGLPQRIPGRRLVPGSVDVLAPHPSPLRTPAAVRENLARHQAGVQDGRAGRHRDFGPTLEAQKGLS